MKPKKIWANLGVSNIERTKVFYEKLGFQVNGTPTNELVSFFFSEEAFIIHFFQKEKLQDSMEGKLTDLTIGNEVMFSISAETKKEFDDWIVAINNANGTILFNSNIDEKPFYNTHGYYVCVFTDPDGHKFNILYNAAK